MTWKRSCANKLYVWIQTKYINRYAQYG